MKFFGLFAFLVLAVLALSQVNASPVSTVGTHESFADADRMVTGNSAKRFRRHPGLIKSAMKGAAVGAAAGGVAHMVG